MSEPLPKSFTVPNGTVEEQAAYIREQLIARNIDPDTLYPLSYDPPDFAQADEDEPLTTTLTIQYENYRPSNPESKETSQDSGEAEQHLVENANRSIAQVLQDWQESLK